MCMYFFHVPWQNPGSRFLLLLRVGASAVIRCYHLPLLEVRVVCVGRKLMPTVFNLRKTFSRIPNSADAVPPGHRRRKKRGDPCESRLKGLLSLTCPR